jgi:RimJ/RimL family protein N-acetyltransferase
MPGAGGARVRTVCMIDPANAASIRVATKCGFHEWTRATYREHETILFERPARVTGHSE